MMEKVTQFIKRTQNLDLNEITTNPEILPEYHDDLEHRIEDLFIWAMGDFAKSNVTRRTVRNNDLNKMDNIQLY